MINRSRNDILAEMLGALEKYGEVSRTKLMYHAMMSNDQAKRYTADLLEKDLITPAIENPKHVMLTNKGLELLNIIKEMKSMVTIGVEQVEPIVHQAKVPVISGMRFTKLTELDHKACDLSAREAAKVKVKPQIDVPPSPTGGRRPSKEMMETARLVAEKVAAMHENRPTKSKERQDVKTLWESGMRSDTKMAKVLGLTRGVVYNHLRTLKLKPKKRKG